MTFDDVLDKHLNAIQTKNFEAFLDTVPHQGELTLLLANGRLMTTAEEFVALNREWFADPDWSLQITLIRKFTGADLGFALVEVNYHDIDRSGNPIDKPYYLNLIFRRHADGRWLLTHDQNTDKSMS